MGPLSNKEINNNPLTNSDNSKKAEEKPKDQHSMSEILKEKGATSSPSLHHRTISQKKEEKLSDSILERGNLNSPKTANASPKNPLLELFEQRLEKATKDPNNVDAQVLLSRHFEKGIGVAKDPTKEMKYTQRAADLGHEASQLKIGMAYQKGDGVEQNSELALKYLQLAANVGNTKAKELIEFEKAVMGSKAISPRMEISMNKKVLTNIHSFFQKENNGISERLSDEKAQFRLLTNLIDKGISNFEKELGDTSKLLMPIEPKSLQNVKANTMQLILDITQRVKVLRHLEKITDTESNVIFSFLNEQQKLANAKALINPATVDKAFSSYERRKMAVEDKLEQFKADFPQVKIKHIYFTEDQITLRGKVGDKETLYHAGNPKQDLKEIQFEEKIIDPHSKSYDVKFTSPDITLYVTKSNIYFDGKAAHSLSLDDLKKDIKNAKPVTQAVHYELEGGMAVTDKTFGVAKLVKVQEGEYHLLIEGKKVVHPNDKKFEYPLSISSDTPKVELSCERGGIHISITENGNTTHVDIDSNNLIEDTAYYLKKRLSNV